MTCPIPGSLWALWTQEAQSGSSNQRVTLLGRGSHPGTNLPPTALALIQGARVGQEVRLGGSFLPGVKAQSSETSPRKGGQGRSDYHGFPESCPRPLVPTFPGQTTLAVSRNEQALPLPPGGPWATYSPFHS